MTIIKKAYKDFVLHDREVGLYFDLAAIEKNFAFLKSLSNERLKFLFPVKSFPTAEVLALASKYSAGFDLSNQAEYELCQSFIKEEMLLWSSAPFVWDYQGTHKLIYDIQNPDRDVPPLSLKSLRVSSDFLNDPQLSRFGLDIKFLQAIDLPLNHIKAIHIHHGIEHMSKDIYLAMIDRLGDILRNDTGVQYVNFGGGFVNFSEATIKDIVLHAQNVFPEKTLIFEPGRWISHNAGFCMGKIKEIVQRDSVSYLITSISRDCHLKWMNTKLHVDFIEGGGKRIPCGNTIVTGPTCFEGDKICEMNELNRKLGSEDCLIVSGVSGYSVAWNTSFNGIPKAPVIYL